eukprot:scaffold275889_cov28-Prasinocladus_malaysianus.AAC.1
MTRPSLQVMPSTAHTFPPPFNRLLSELYYVSRVQATRSGSLEKHEAICQHALHHLQHGK